MKILNFFKKPKVDPQELYNQAMKHIKQDKWGKAAELLKKGTQLLPDNALFHHTYAAALGKCCQSNDQAEIERNFSIICSEYITALDLHDQFGGLENKHIRLACDAVVNYYRVTNQYGQANRFVERSMGYFPQDSYFLSLQAQIYWEAEQSENAEKWALKSLEVDMENDNARKIWKKARKAQGRNFFSDLPEEKKQNIYKELCEIKNDIFLSNLSGLEQGNDNQTLADIQNAFNKSSQISKETAHSRITGKYKISSFEISLIEQEGKLKSWGIGKAAVPEKPIRSRVAFRDNLRCIKCNTPQSAAYWPKDGDQTAYYAQSAEKTQNTPGDYALPIKCPHCSTIWYVVWDKNPGDPIGGHFVKHFNRVFESFPSNVDLLYGYISDKVLGKVVQLLQEQVIDSNLEDTQLDAKLPTFHTDTFQPGSTFHVVTMIPTGNLSNARNYFLGRYMQYLMKIASESGPPSLFSEVRLAHWAFCFSWDEKIAHVQLAFVPSDEDPHELETIVPSEFMTENDMNEFLMFQCQRLPDEITLRYNFSEQNSVKVKESIIKVIKQFGAYHLDFGLSRELGVFSLQVIDNLGEMLLIFSKRGEDLSLEYTIRLLRPSDTHTRMLMLFCKKILQQMRNQQQ